MSRFKWCEKCGKTRAKELVLKDGTGCYVCKEKKWKQENEDKKQEE